MVSLLLVVFRDMRLRCIIEDAPAGMRVFPELIGHIFVKGLGGVDRSAEPIQLSAHIEHLVHEVLTDVRHGIARSSYAEEERADNGRSTARQVAIVPILERFLSKRIYWHICIYRMVGMLSQRSVKSWKPMRLTYSCPIQ